MPPVAAANLSIPVNPDNGTALRPAVLGGPDRLSPEARLEILALSGARPWRFLSELVFHWVVIAAAIGAGIHYSNIAVTVLCICLVGTRQMALGLLLHDQVHRLGMRWKYGDWIVNIFAGYPLFATTVEDYAKVHLSHHKYFMTPKDPDFVRKSGEEWTFPASWKMLLKIFITDVTGLNTVKLIRGKTAPANVMEFNRRRPSPKWLRLTFYAVLIVTLTLVHGWLAFLVYWVLPILTTFQLMIRWTAVVEHKYNVENASVFEVTPLVRLKLWQRILLPDLNFAMHAYHHMHPGVSFANLPKVHEIYKREGLVDESAIFNGQGAYLWYLLRKGK